jgi:outer membrane protein
MFDPVAPNFKNLMKKFSFLAAAFCASLFASALTASAQQFKVAAVDMTKIFAEYYKTKKAETDLKSTVSTYEKEVRDQESVVKKLGEDFKRLQEEAENPAFTDEKRSEKRKQLEAKMSEGRIARQKLEDMFTNRRKDLDERRNKIRGTLVEEISKVIQEKAKKDGYQLVVDKTGQSLNGVNPFIFVHDSLDITAEVIKLLNATAPAAAKK